MERRASGLGVGILAGTLREQIAESARLVRAERGNQSPPGRMAWIASIRERLAREREPVS